MKDDRLRLLADQIEALKQAQKIARQEADPEHREHLLRVVDRAVEAASAEHAELQAESEKRPKLRIIPGGLIAFPGIAAAAAWARRRPATAAGAATAVIAATTAVALSIGSVSDDQITTSSPTPPARTPTHHVSPSEPPFHHVSPSEPPFTTTPPPTTPPISSTSPTTQQPIPESPTNSPPEPTSTLTHTPEPEPTNHCSDITIGRLKIPLPSFLPVNLCIA